MLAPRHMVQIARFALSEGELRGDYSDCELLGNLVPARMRLN